MVDNWYILLIIVTIIGFLVTIALSFYFVYIPALRASNKFDDITRRGSDIIKSGQVIGNDVNDTAVILSDFYVALCEGIANNEGVLLSIINETGSFDETCAFILSC
uniref:Uncharacterized protein n=1 Tax=Pithovirus LCPAC102 TaxID=2506587 RepID=A0A4D5XF69_9VIRU|nr:MAG: hypothetical protein LCPAC102_01620 [Pithovirus LCPAC102]